MSKKRLLLTNPLFDLTIERLCQQVIENHGDFENTVLLGLQPRGVLLALRIHAYLVAETKVDIPFGLLDATFYRDDFRRRDSPLTPNATSISFGLEDKNVVLIDDVIATGRMVRAAFDAMQAFGRPLKIELLCLIDRNYNRDIPIQPDYVGRTVNTLDDQQVVVEWKEQKLLKDKIWLVD
ncbi:MAG: bifunctional pyr operon transcriptional regulator/uracil phosphoribosyltransferase PyrR [Spirosomataceae bacterium]